MSTGGSGARGAVLCDMVGRRLLAGEDETPHWVFHMKHLSACGPLSEVSACAVAIMFHMKHSREP